MDVDWGHASPLQIQPWHAVLCRIPGPFFFFSLSLLQLRENTPRLESEDASLALITVAHWWSSVEPAFAHRISTGSSGAVPLN